MASLPDGLHVSLLCTYVSSTELSGGDCPVRARTSVDRYIYAGVEVFRLRHCLHVSQLGARSAAGAGNAPHAACPACLPPVDRGQGELAVPGARHQVRRQTGRQDVGRAASGGAGRADGVLGHRHVAGRQRAVRAAAAAGGAPARGLGAAVVHGDGGAAGQRRPAAVRAAAPPAAARVRRLLHLHAARRRRAGARAQRLLVRPNGGHRRRGALRRILIVDFLRRARGLHQLRAVLPVPAAFPRRVPSHVLSRRGAERLRVQPAGAGAGRGRRARVPAVRRQQHAGGALPARALRHHRVPAAAGRAGGRQPGRLRAHQQLPRLPAGARGAGRRRQGRRGDGGAAGAGVAALGGRHAADGGAERAQQRRAAVGAVVLVHAVRHARLPPGRDAGRHGGAGGVPGGRVAAAAGGARAGGRAGGGGARAGLHPGHRAAQPRAAAAARPSRGSASRGVVGVGVGRDSVRAHVGVRVGAGRRRAGHAAVRRARPARLRAGLRRHLRARQLHAAVRAARRLPRIALVIRNTLYI